MLLNGLGGSEGKIRIPLLLMLMLMLYGSCLPPRCFTAEAFKSEIAGLQRSTDF